jgi:carbamate kinase
MKKKKITLALGHDALGTTLPEQKKATRKAAKAIADLVQDECQVVITHSNGPQVGMIHTAMAEFHRLYKEYTATPMSVCSAMSQGYIGYDLQNAIRAELISRGVYKTVSTVLTQVIVDPYDDAFYAPSKIIGRVMNEQDAEEEEHKGNHVVAVENGYRRIVAAPKPMEIVEIDAVRALLSADQIVIAAGGGGIPVLSQGYELKGASAVIEKDLAAGLLADEVNADVLILLTDQEFAYRDYGSDAASAIRDITCKEAEQLLTDGHFGEGTMAPKFETALKFIGDSAVRRVIITRLDCMRDALEGNTGTHIHK